MNQRHIVIDWGTTNFRAWLVNSSDGVVLDEIDEGRGLSSLETHEFPDYCQSHLQAWLNEDRPSIYMAGMVGAALGWQAAPQLPLPVSVDQLVEHTVAASGMQDVWIVPGTRVDGHQPDVMRGEEIQIFGALELAERSDAVLCLPGTHSKWAQVSNKSLTHFTTSMTGEMYNILLKHSIIARSAETAIDDQEAFKLGARNACKDGGLLHQLFATRARSLYAGLKPSSVPSYVSGLLIGSEVQAMQALYPASEDKILLVCAKSLAAPYQTVLEDVGYKVQCVDAKEASLSGCNTLSKIHRQSRN